MTYEIWGSTVAVTTPTNGTKPTVAGIGLDRFAYVWQDMTPDASDTSGYGIRMRVYDPFGAPLTGYLVVNTSTLGDQVNAQVLGLAGGNFVVVWQDNYAVVDDWSGTAIRAQMFDVDGMKLGEELLVNTTIQGNQQTPAIARNGDGFVVAWVDTSEGVNVRAQRFDPNGSKLGGEITAGAAGTVYAADTEGGFVLATGTSLQVYGSDGVPRGNAFRVEAWEVEGVDRVDSDGNFAVSYQQGSYLRNAIFDSKGVLVADVVVEVVRDSYRIPGMFYDPVVYSASNVISPWNTVTLASASSVVTNSTMTQWGFPVTPPTYSSSVYADALTAAGLSGGASIHYNTSGLSAFDAAMLLDGRVVIAHGGGGAGLGFTIIDGRGANFGAFYNDAPTVLVGVDAGPDMHNVITGSSFAESLYGMGGNDYLYGYAGHDVLVGGTGSDVLLADEGNDVLYGGDDADYLYGGAGSNVYYGGAGVDVLISDVAGRNDTMFGGDEGDYLYAYATSATVAFGEGGNDIFVMQSAPAQAHGGDGQDYFYMGAFSDAMHGGAGVDVLLGGGGADTYDAGAGTDYLFLGSGADRVRIDLQSGVDVVNGFDVSQDVVQLIGTGMASFQQVLSATTDYGSFCVISIDEQTAIWLIGVAASDMTAGNFEFS